MNCSIRSTHFLAIHLLAILLAVASFLSFAAPTVRAADKDKDDDWKRLGDKLVENSADRDQIEVGGEEGTFKSIKLSVKGADIELISLRVVFASGDDQNVEVRKNIRDGSETRPINLDGRNRVIRKVVMIYKTEKSKDRARVTLWGRK